MTITSQRDVTVTGDIKYADLNNDGVINDKDRYNAGNGIPKLTSGLFFDVLQRYDPGNLLLSQATREVLERQLESTRLAATLRRLSRATIVVRQPRRVTPLAFPLLVDRARERVTSESLTDRIRRMQLALERAAG